MCLTAFAPSNGLNQLAHSRRLIKAFADRQHINLIIDRHYDAKIRHMVWSDFMQGACVMKHIFSLWGTFFFKPIHAYNGSILMWIY